MLSRTHNLWFTMFALVGAASGILAGGLLWMIVTRPLLLLQTLAGLP